MVDIAAGQREAATKALARAVAAGALGAGYAVRRDGDGFVFDGGARSDGPDGGRIDLGNDGKARYGVSLAGAERRRVAEAVLLGTLAGFAATMLWSWLWPPSLAWAGAVAVTYAVARIVGDRRRTRARLGALLRSLPVLVDRVDAGAQ